MLGADEMELLQLNYFLKVAKHQSISKAADELDISESYLSKMISLLETELELKLFDRVGRGICLNEYGKVFVNSVNSSISALDTGIDQLKKLSKVQFGTINIGVFAYTAIIAGCVSEYSRLNPHVKFKLVSYVDEKVGNGILDYDLFLYSQPIRHTNISSILILKENFVVVLPKSHPLAFKGTINLLEIKNERFVFMCSNAFFLDASYHICREAGFEPKVYYVTDSDRVKFNLINSEVAITLIPEVCIEDVSRKSPNLAFINIEGVDCQRSVYFGWRNEKRTNQLTEDFKKFAIEYFKHYKL